MKNNKVNISNLSLLDKLPQYVHNCVKQFIIAGPLTLSKEKKGLYYNLNSLHLMRLKKKRIYY